MDPDPGRHRSGLLFLGQEVVVAEGSLDGDLMFKAIASELVPFLPFYAAAGAVIIYLARHEKKHSRITIYLKLICKKLDIPCDEKDA